MADPNKDTIYIDIDDEITGIIDKLRGSGGKVVALVLPKRAGVFQSIVNMKLLKRAADDSKKNLVLITTEAGLLPLAGAAGIHVAKTLTSKPEIPTAPQLDDDGEETVQESGDEPEITAANAGEEPVGKLAGLSGAAAAADGVETLELDDDELPEDAAAAVKSPKPKTFDPPTGKDKKGKKNKKLHIPNFERFRLWIILGGIVLLLLIIGLIIAFVALPKATISVTTDATNVNVSTNLSLSTTASSLDLGTNTVPAKLATEPKTYSQQVATTGQKNEGNKASGNVTVTNCGASDATIPAGTGFSSGGNTYISQQTVSVPVSDFKGFQGKCENDGQATVNVTAQSGGSSYNLPASSPFTISNAPSGLSASGSTTGGTDNNVQVVNQNDINNAKAKISTNDSAQKQFLQNELKQQGYYAIASTFSAGTPNVSNSANVGDTASTVTVTEAVTYTMFGAHESDLKSLIDNNVKGQINTDQQSILSEGLDTATFSVNSSSTTSAQIALQTTAEAGPQLDTNGIKQQAAGKKPGDVKSQLQTNPDVTGVNIKLSPFWVSTVPKKTSRITVTIAKPKPKTTASNANANNP